MLDIVARNEAIDVMWLQSYLTNSRVRPTWAYIADEIFAGAIRRADSRLDPSVRINQFVQSWKTSQLHPSLPTDLKRMLMIARKYNLVLNSPNPSEKMCLALPIWSHIAQDSTAPRCNSRAVLCLRDKHSVLTVADAQAVANRILQRLGHQAHSSCPCVSCRQDHDMRACEHPYKCAAAALKALGSIKEKWHPAGQKNQDGLSLRRSNRNDRDQPPCDDPNGSPFDPSLTSGDLISQCFRIFPTISTESMRALRKPNVTGNFSFEPMTALASSMTKGGMSHLAKGAAMAFFGVNDRRNTSANIRTVEIMQIGREMEM